MIIELFTTMDMQITAPSLWLNANNGVGERIYCLTSSSPFLYTTVQANPRIVPWLIPQLMD